MQAKQGVEQAWVRGFAAAVSWLVHFGLDPVLATRCMKAVHLSPDKVKAAGIPAHEWQELSKKLGAEAPTYHVHAEHDVSYKGERSSSGVRIYKVSEAHGEPCDPTLVMVIGSKRTEVVRGVATNYYSFDGLDPLKVGVPVGEVDFLRLVVVGLDAQHEQNEFRAAWDARDKPSNGQITVMKQPPPAVATIRTVKELQEMVYGVGPFGDIQALEGTSRASSSTPEVVARRGM